VHEVVNRPQLGNGLLGRFPDRGLIGHIEHRTPSPHAGLERDFAGHVGRLGATVPTGDVYSFGSQARRNRAANPAPGPRHDGHMIAKM
jgi:hypothetical protein